jgi:glyoxylase-like metal-dependent hydrolase (beta-lactamase superfamily II)
VHRIWLPFHLELNHVYVHLVPWEDGWILIDTGFGKEDCWQALTNALREQKIEWRAIHTLVLTHCHPDHMGNALRVMELSGARLHMHPREVGYLEDMVSRPGVDPRLEEWGTPPEMLETIANAMGTTGRYFARLTPDVPIDTGDRVGPFEVIWTPGHARGHVCLYDRSARRLIAGDHVLPTITPHVGWEEDEDALGNFLRSIDLVSRLDAVEVLPSHGDIFSNLGERCREIAVHHEWRCELVRRAVTEGARTPHEVVETLWQPGRFATSPFQYRFAIYEVMAHLRHLGIALHSISV